MRTTRPKFEGEDRYKVSVSINLMRVALRDLLPRGRVKLVDVEWDGKHDQINFFYETEQDVLAALESSQHATNQARKEYCDCKGCELDREEAKGNTGESPGSVERRYLGLLDS